MKYVRRPIGLAVIWIAHRFNRASIKSDSVMRIESIGWRIYGDHRMAEIFKPPTPD